MGEKSAMLRSELWNWSSNGNAGGDSFLRFREVNNRVQCLWDMEPFESEVPFQASIELAQMGDCVLSRARTDPLTGYRERSHIDTDEQDFFSLMYMVEGRMVFSQRDFETCVPQHHIVLWDSARPAKTQFDQPIRQLHVMIPRSAAMSIIPGIERLCGLAIDGNGQIGRILGSHLLQLEESISSVPLELRPRIMDATLQLIGAIFQPQEAQLGRAARRPALLRIERYILDNIGDPDLSIRSIADELGYSERHIHRLFDGFDFSVSDWIRRRRLLAARTALASTPSSQVSVAQIAYRFGFRQQSHFSRAFSAAFGVSPRRFRENPHPNTTLDIGTT